MAGLDLLAGGLPCPPLMTMTAAALPVEAATALAVTATATVTVIAALGGITMTTAADTGRRRAEDLRSTTTHHPHHAVAMMNPTAVTTPLTRT